MEKTSNTLKSYEPLLTKILINFKETRKLFRASQSVRIFNGSSKGDIDENSTHLTDYHTNISWLTTFN